MQIILVILLRLGFALLLVGMTWLASRSLQRNAEKMMKDEDGFPNGNSYANMVGGFMIVVSLLIKAIGILGALGILFNS